jgi:hypothetical protein
VLVHPPVVAAIFFLVVVIIPAIRMLEERIGHHAVFVLFI